jgi:glycosyltransferase involved in cell wall biosynthesis
VKPTLLFVSPRFLFPTDEGGKIRTANILRQMKGGAFHIRLASPAPPDAAAFKPDIDAVCDEFIAWPATPNSQLRRIRALLDRRPVSVATDDTPQGRAAVARALAAAPDILLVDFPHAAVLTPAPFAIPSICFTHNVEAEIYERHARVATGPMRLLWPAQARKMQRFEGETLRRFDTVIAVSKRDAKALEARFGLHGVAPIDTGVDLVFFEPTPPPATTGTVVFTGVMDSPANIEGVRFLIERVWPILIRTRPDAKALIIGRNPPESLKAAAPPTFTFTGTVDDIRPHFARGDLAVIPLNVGSGTRIKAFEAMAMGRPVVSTTIGVEGLDVIDGQHLLIADDALTFAAAIARLLEDPTLRQTLATNARSLVEQRFSWAHVARQFEAICLGTLTPTLAPTENPAT